MCEIQPDKCSTSLVNSFKEGGISGGGGGVGGGGGGGGLAV
jgi:hypothetical protein